MTLKMHTFGMAGRRTAQILCYDLENLPPDTFILYPDILDESLTEFNLGLKLSNSLLPMSAISNFQKAANLDYLLHFESPTDIVRAKRSIQDALAPAQRAEIGDIHQPEKSVARHTLSDAENLSLHWSWFRAAICYIALGFITCSGLFVFPLLRHPQPRLTENGGSKLFRAANFGKLPSLSDHSGTSSTSALLVALRTVGPF